MAQLSANGESDRTDSPLSVEGKRLASPFPFSITQPTLAIKESFRSLRLTPDLTSALIQALINISIAPTADTTASSLDNATQTATTQTCADNYDTLSVPETYGEQVVTTTPATARVLSPAVTAAPIVIRDAVSTPAACGIPTPIANPAAIQSIVSSAIVTATAAQIATPAADAPVVVPGAGAAVVTLATAAPIVAPQATLAGAAPVVASPIAGTPAVAAPTSTTVVNYHLPAAGAAGPYYCVTRGRDIGVYAGW